MDEIQLTTRAIDRGAKVDILQESKEVVIFMDNAVYTLDEAKTLGLIEEQQ